MASSAPPRYILVSQSPLLSDVEPDPPSTSLSHPHIHYQYADDAPTAIPMSLPSDAQIIYLDIDPVNPSHAQARSSSDAMISTGVTISDAVGALPSEDPRLYVVNTGGLQSKTALRDDPKLVLRDYRERLSATRQVIELDLLGSKASPEFQTRPTENDSA